MTRPGRTSVRGPATRGQATVEAALLLPVIAMAALAVIQIGLIVHARVMVTHAAREGARIAAVDGGSASIRDTVIASGGLAPDRLQVDADVGGERTTVVVTYRAPTNVPLVGALIGDVELVGAATMRRER